MPIAVVPFGWQGSGPAAFDLAGVVSADLGSSGRFAPMATRDMVSRPTQASQVNFQQWRTLEADYLVIGTLHRGCGRTISRRRSSSSTWCAASR